MRDPEGGSIQLHRKLATAKSFIVPSNAQHVHIKTLKYFTLKYIKLAPTCFGFD
jgi:hypothetical protein